MTSMANCLILAGVSEDSTSRGSKFKILTVLREN